MLNALAVLRFLHNLSYGIVHELSHAVSIISLGKKPSLVVLPRLPAAVGVAVVGQTACLVVLVVYDRAVGKVCLNYCTVEVSVIATFRTVETLFKNHRTIEVAPEEVPFAELVLNATQPVVGIVSVVHRADLTKAARTASLTKKVAKSCVFQTPALVAACQFNRKVVSVVGDMQHTLAGGGIAGDATKAVTTPLGMSPIAVAVCQRATISVVSTGLLNTEAILDD